MARALCRTVSPQDMVLANRTPAKAEALAAELGCRTGSNENAALCDLVMLAVKPQMMASMLAPLQPLLAARTDRFILCTMAAGLSMDQIRQMAGGDYPVFRINPNIPSSTGEGMIPYCAAGLTPEEEAECVRILSGAGRVDSIPESLIDAASCVSGCGPAWAYQFIEALADGGVACGLPRAKATEYAARCCWAAPRCCWTTGRHPGALKDAVCSPGGTTIPGRPRVGGAGLPGGCDRRGHRRLRKDLQAPGGLRVCASLSRWAPPPSPIPRAAEHPPGRRTGEGAQRPENAGHEMVLVSSGAIGMGVGKLSLSARPADMAGKQACAAVGQCELMYTYDRLFADYNHTVAQILLTGVDVEHTERRQNFENTLYRLLELGALPIINENDTVSTMEIASIGDNDTLAAIVACCARADLLVLLSDIDGLYTANPRTHPDARLIPLVEDVTPDILHLSDGAGSALGTGGMATKLRAAQMVTADGVEMVIANGAHPELLYQIAEGQPAGTRFAAKPRRHG